MKYKLKIISIAFIITFITLSSLSIFIAATIIKPQNKQPQNNKAQFEFVIPKEQDLNILLIVYEKNANSAHIFETIKLSAHDNCITLASFPTEISTVAATKFGNLKELYELGGVTIVKEAIENLASIEIDRTIELTDEAVEEIINNIGGLKIPCDKDDNEKATQIHDEKDYKLLEGKQFCNNLKNDPSNALACLNFTISQLSNLNQPFSLIQKKGETNISNYDFETRKNGFKKMLTSENTTLKIIKPNFTNFNDRQKLTDTSKQEIQQAFEK